MICLRLWRLSWCDFNHEIMPVAQTLIFCVSQEHPTTLATLVCVCGSTHLANPLVTTDTQMDGLLRFLTRPPLPPPPVLHNLPTLCLLLRQLPRIPHLPRPLNRPQTSSRLLRPSPAQQHPRHPNNPPIRRAEIQTSETNGGKNSLRGGYCPGEDDVSDQRWSGA